MSDLRTIEWAVDIIGMCKPIRCHQGGMWFGHNHNFADATFVDYGAADAFAVAAQALPTLVKALEETRAALDAMKTAVEASGKLNDRGYIPLGIQVNNALDKAGAILGHVSAATERNDG